MENEDRTLQLLKMTAPGTALRVALDYDHCQSSGCPYLCRVENVLAAGGDGFKRCFFHGQIDCLRLLQMDGAVVVDKGLTRLLRQPLLIPSQPFNGETGVPSPIAAARMSLLTKSVVIAVSSRRSLISVYVDGRYSVEVCTQPLCHCQSAFGCYAKYTPAT